MGLGLSIVSYILAMHGTKLRIESREGEGSSFGFDLLPLMVAQAVSAPLSGTAG